MSLVASARRGRLRAFSAYLTGVIIIAALSVMGPDPLPADEGIYLRVRDWRSGAVLAEEPAKVGDRLFFGWIHSLEKFPWNEYYHIDENLDLILDAITFPAFGAGVPENKGRICYVRNGLIHMEEIYQRFSELVWLNSHTATQEIRLNDKHIARGSELPQHGRVRLTIERSY